jgi:S-(hydroxymethyl)glutathione dehydrogenase/alcohol dehydrogenase
VVGAGRADAMVQFSAQELFLHDKRLLGSFYGGADVRRDYPMLLRLWQAGKLDLDGMITTRITLDEVNEALRALRDGANVIRQMVVC